MARPVESRDLDFDFLEILGGLVEVEVGRGRRRGILVIRRWV